VRLLLLVVVAVAAIGRADAAIQRCVREDGSIVFTDTVCPKGARPVGVSSTKPALTPNESVPPVRSRPALASPSAMPATARPDRTMPRRAPASVPKRPVPSKDPWQRPDFPAPPPF